MKAIPVKALASLVTVLLIILGSRLSLADIPDISQQQLLDAMASGKPPVLLDVRSPAEYDSGHVAGAQNIPHNELAKRLTELTSDKSQQVVVYCRSGRRAGMAAKVLVENGYSQVQHLTGDMNGWYEAKLPVQQ